LPFTSSGGRTELVWKHDIRLGCKGLRLNAKDADQIDYCSLGKWTFCDESRTSDFLAPLEDCEKLAYFEGFRIRDRLRQTGGNRFHY